MGAAVSVIVPARNEARFVEACVRSLLAQEVEGGLEVIVADGRSEDDTAARAAAAGATVVDNPERGIPQGLNLALAAASGAVVARFDAHSEMPPGYLAACLRALEEEPGAVNVGGWCRAEGTTPWGRALGAALASPLGVGNARIWRAPPPGAGRREVETVPFGCFRADELRAAGGWNEALLANEDFELNHRLRARGGRVVFDPAVWSIYRPRETLGAIAGQYWRYGTWKARMLAEAPSSLRPRQLAPLGLLAAVALAAAPGPPGRAGRLGLAGYAATLAAAAARSEGGWRVAPVLATVHLAWGAALVSGLVRAGAAEAAGGRPSRASSPGR